MQNNDKYGSFYVNDSEIDGWVLSTPSSKIQGRKNLMKRVLWICEKIGDTDTGVRENIAYELAKMTGQLSLFGLAG